MNGGRVHPVPRGPCESLACVLGQPFFNRGSALIPEVVYPSPIVDPGTGLGRWGGTVVACAVAGGWFEDAVHVVEDGDQVADVGVDGVFQAGLVGHAMVS
jgi:hypothetical protein